MDSLIILGNSNQFDKVMDDVLTITVCPRTIVQSVDERSLQFGTSLIRLPSERVSYMVLGAGGIVARDRAVIVNGILFSEAIFHVSQNDGEMMGPYAHAILFRRPEGVTFCFSNDKDVLSDQLFFRAPEQPRQLYTVLEGPVQTIFPALEIARAILKTLSKPYETDIKDTKDTYTYTNSLCAAQEFFCVLSQGKYPMEAFTDYLKRVIHRVKPRSSAQVEFRGLTRMVADHDISKIFFE